MIDITKMVDDDDNDPYLSSISFEDAEAAWSEAAKVIVDRREQR